MGHVHFYALYALWALWSKSYEFRILRIMDSEPNVLFTTFLCRSWTPKSAWQRSRQPSYSESKCDYI
jgi:hypothetical protein